MTARSLLALPFGLLLACGGAVASVPGPDGTDSTDQKSSSTDNGSSTDTSTGTTKSSTTTTHGTTTSPPPDAGVIEVDASSTDSQFPCGSSAICDSATEYCHIVQGGPPPPPGTEGGSFTCEKFADIGCGNNHSCACLASTNSANQCTDDNGDITSTLDVP